MNLKTRILLLTAVGLTLVSVGEAVSAKPEGRRTAAPITIEMDKK